MNFPTLLSALGNLTRAIEEISCDAEFDDEDDDLGSTAMVPIYYMVTHHVGHTNPMDELVIS